MSPSNIAVVLVPVFKERPSAAEEIAFQQCIAVLNDFPVILVAPNELNVGFYMTLSPTVRVSRFSPRYFRSVKSYSRLLLSPKFYQRFIDYEYLLIHQLDAFVFKDELQYWCEQEFDYIGAPWFEGFSLGTTESRFAGVGNGGFSLRRIRSCLKALHSFSWIMKPNELWQIFKCNPPLSRVLRTTTIPLRLAFTNNTFYLLNSFKYNEDSFWGHYVNRNFSWFRVPAPDIAMQFSFESNAPELFELNDNQLPFGCHGWTRYDTDFWRLHIESFGYQLD